MTGDTLYNSLLDAIRKDFRGVSLSIDEFNRLSVIVNRRLLADYCKKFEDGIESSSSVGAFKELDYPLTVTGGVASLPSDYYQLIGEPYYTDSGSTVRGIDIVTSLEHAKRERDYLTKSTLKHPTCVVGSMNSSGNLEIRVYPTSITSISVDYIRLPATPFLDYYVNDTTLAVTYMLAGVQNFTIPTGSTYRDGTTGIKNSATVDWEWGEDELPILITYFMQAMGIALPDQLLIQSAALDKQQIEQ